MRLPRTVKYNTSRRRGWIETHKKDARQSLAGTLATPCRENVQQSLLFSISPGKHLLLLLYEEAYSARRHKYSLQSGEEMETKQFTFFAFPPSSRPLTPRPCHVPHCFPASPHPFTMWCRLVRLKPNASLATTAWTGPVSLAPPELSARPRVSPPLPALGFAQPGTIAEKLKLYSERGVVEPGGIVPKDPVSPRRSALGTTPSGGRLTEGLRG